jgi:hypothetical protein
MSDRVADRDSFALCCARLQLETDNRHLCPDWSRVQLIGSRALGNPLVLCPRP